MPNRQAYQSELVNLRLFVSTLGASQKIQLMDNLCNYNYEIFNFSFCFPLLHRFLMNLRSSEPLTCKDVALRWFFEVAPSCVYMLPCKEVTNSEANSNDESLTYVERFQCCLCDVNFNMRHLIVRHYKEQHYDKLPKSILGEVLSFHCEVCEVSFKRKDHLVRHEESNFHRRRLEIFGDNQEELKNSIKQESNANTSQIPDDNSLLLKRKLTVNYSNASMANNDAHDEDNDYDDNVCNTTKLAKILSTSVEDIKEFSISNFEINNNQHNISSSSVISENDESIKLNCTNSCDDSICDQKPLGQFGTSSVSSCSRQQQSPERSRQSSNQYKETYAISEEVLDFQCDSYELDSIAEAHRRRFQAIVQNANDSVCDENKNKMNDPLVYREQSQTVRFSEMGRIVRSWVMEPLHNDTLDDCPSQLITNNIANESTCKERKPLVKDYDDEKYKNNIELIERTSQSAEAFSEIGKIVRSWVMEPFHDDTEQDRQTQHHIGLPQSNSFKSIRNLLKKEIDEEEEEEEEEDANFKLCEEDFIRNSYKLRCIVETEGAVIVDSDEERDDYEMIRIASIYDDYKNLKKEPHIKDECVNHDNNQGYLLEKNIECGDVHTIDSKNRKAIQRLSLDIKNIGICCEKIDSSINYNDNSEIKSLRKKASTFS